jgi:D-inositol-3-phosphate glycosyltransferase
LVDLEGRPEGSTCSLTVEAVGRSGRTTLGNRTVTIGPVLRPVKDGGKAWTSALSARTTLSVRARAGREARESLNALVVTHDLGLGGAQLWLDQIVMRLLSEGDVSCTVMAPRDGEMRRRLEDAGAQVHLFGEVPGDAGLYESKVRDMVDRVADDDVDVVLANTVNAFVGVDVALRCGLPSVYAIHEHYPRNVLLRNLFGADGVDEHVAARFELAMQNSTAIGFVSDATRKLFVPDDMDGRALTIDYGIDLEEVADARRRLDRDRLREKHGFPPSAKVLVCVAALCARKCPVNLVMAFARIAADTRDAHLALVGGLHDSYAEALSTLIDALGLEHRARVISVTPDVAQWWTMADGFVLPSDAESLPRSILEAMAYEVPVLATDVGGVSELVHDGVTGSLVRPNDIEDLTLRIRRLLDTDPADLKVMTKAAAREVRATRDGSGYVEAYLKLLRGLARDPLAPPRSICENR